MKSFPSDPLSPRRSIASLILGAPAIFLASLLLSGCVGSYYIKENLSAGQISSVRINRKPADDKTMGIIPKYYDYLEGYIMGGLQLSSGKPAQGVIVTVKDDKGKDVQGFESGVSDSSGAYKIPFSIPLIWSRVDVWGTLSYPADWKVVGRPGKFRLYFDRRNGLLLYLPKEAWATIRNKAEPDPLAPPGLPKPAAKPAKKPGGDDAFGDFGFDP